MRKVGLILLIIFVFCLQVEASTWLFVWDEETTTIEIPLGSTLQNYIHIPKAKLLKDQKELTDAKIEYIPTGDWLYLLTDVDTSKVGEYQVWYKAVETKYRPGQCQGYKTLITFKVVDKEPPEIVSYPKSLKYLIGQELPNYKSKIVAVDNSNTCEIIIDDSSVLYDIPGKYPVYIQANDGYNITMVEIDLEVEDPIGPIITFKGDNNHIILAKGEMPDIINYFTAYDQIDGDVTHSIQYPKFDTSKEGIFDLEVSFKDNQGNQSIILVTVEIVNQDEIEIELFHQELILEYNKDITDSLKNNIKKALYGKKDICNVISIDASNIKPEVGSYKVRYCFSENEKSKVVECEVKLLAVTPPVLLVQNISIPIGQKPNYLDYITVQDPSDTQVSSKIQWNDSLVDYTKEGTYLVNVSVVNSSNLSTTETIIVSIYAENQKESFDFKLTLFCICFGSITLITLGLIVFMKYRKRKETK